MGKSYIYHVVAYAELDSPGPGLQRQAIAGAMSGVETAQEIIKMRRDYGYDVPITLQAQTGVGLRILKDEWYCDARDWTPPKLVVCNVCEGAGCCVCNFSGQCKNKHWRGWYEQQLNDIRERLGYEPKAFVGCVGT